MRHSESLASLAPALIRAQQRFPTIGKDATNPDYRSAYATLDKIVETIRPILAAENLAVLQGAAPNESGKSLVVTSRLVHMSGEWIESDVVMPLVGRMLKGGGRAEPDPQAAGSAVSYGRRYGVCALLNLVTGEDDDGNAASKVRPAKAAAPARQPQQKPAQNRVVPTVPYADQVFDGRRVGDMPKDELTDLMNRARKAGNAEWADVFSHVLADRALGNGDAAAVQRAKDAEAKFSGELPFK